MKKLSRALAVALVAMLAVCVVALSACGGSAPESKAKDTLSVTSEPAQTEPEPEPVVLRTDPFYVLVVGSDSREGTVNKSGQYADGLGRSDTLMLVRVDPSKYKLTLITIPRDTQAEWGGKRCKINETFHFGGIEGLHDAVEDLTGVDADYYLITTFVGFQNLIDNMGGLTVDVPIDEEMADIVTNEMVTFPAGEQTLNGKEALVFARERHAYEFLYDGNLQEAYRQTNDRYILQTMIQTILADPDKVADLTETLLDDIETNWDAREIAGYAEDFAKNIKKLDFIRCTGPYAGDIDYETQLWLAYRDEDTWAQIIDVVNKGEDPSDIVPIVSAAE